MARPFEIAHENEEVVMTEIESGPATVEDVIEESEAVEEEANVNAEVDQNIEALETSSEEADALLDQADNNEEVIENAEASGEEESPAIDEQITASEENLKYSMIKLGYDDGLKERISFAKEAHSSSLEKLRVSTEGVKDFILKIISTIKTLIRKIVISVQKLYAKIGFKFARYGKQLELLRERLRDLESAKSVTPAKMSAEDIADLEKEYAAKFVRIDPMFAATNVANYVTTKKNMAKDLAQVMASYEAASKKFLSEAISSVKAAEKDISKWKSNFKKAREHIKSLFDNTHKKNKDINYSKFGQLPSDFSGSIQMGNIANTIYYIPADIDNSGVLKRWTVPGDFTVENVFGKIDGLFKDVIKEVPALINSAYNDVKNSKQVFKTFDDTEKKYLQALDQMEKDNQRADKDAAKSRAMKQAIDFIRIGAAEINLYCVRKFIWEIKTTVRVCNTAIDLYEDANEIK